MALQKPCIFSFHLTSPFITNPSDILAYLIRHYFYTPANITENYIDNEIVFAKTFAKHKNNITLLSESMKNDLYDLIGRYFDNVTVSITPQPKYQTDDVRYSLEVDVVVTYNNKQYGITPNLDVSGHKFEIRFSDV